MERQGYCNRCGSCCTVKKRKKTYHCQHLIRLGNIGTPNATLCAIHDARRNPEPIIMISEDGTYIRELCIPDFPQDGDKLPKSCTYRFAKSE